MSYNFFDFRGKKLLAQSVGFIHIHLTAITLSLTHTTHRTHMHTAANTTASTADITLITQGKGQFVKVSFKSTKKPAAAFKGTELVKVSSGVFRSGIDFSNLASVKEGIANGEREAVGSLPWGEWVSFPYLIAHKGEQYVRLYPSVGHKVEVKHFVNGKEVSKDEFNSFLTPSDAKPSSEAIECFTIKASNIISVG